VKQPGTCIANVETPSGWQAQLYRIAKSNYRLVITDPNDTPVYLHALIESTERAIEALKAFFAGQALTAVGTVLAEVIRAELRN